MASRMAQHTRPCRGLRSTKSGIGLNVKPGVKSFAASAKVEKSLRYSIYDGAANATTTDLTQDYIAPLALALKATSTQIGLLTSIANLAAALFPLKAPAILRRAGYPEADDPAHRPCSGSALGTAGSQPLLCLISHRMDFCSFSRRVAEISF